MADPKLVQLLVQAATENQQYKMQNYCKTIGALAAASALVAGNASAEVEYELHTGYSSMYLFRGLDLGDDLVEAGVDVASEWNGLSLSAGAWYASVKDMPNPIAGRPSDNNDELDLYCEVAKDLGFVTVSTGYIFYHYPQGNDNSNYGPIDDAQEIYFALSRDFGFAAMSLTYFWDIEGDNEGYSEFAMSRSFELNQCLSLNVGTSVGYLVEGGDFTAWTTKVALDWGFAEHAKLSPFIALAIALGESSHSSWSSTENELLGGAMLSVNF
jgi:hypothetical protein